VSEQLGAVDDLVGAMGGAALQLCRAAAICGNSFDDAHVRVDRSGISRSILEVEVFLPSEDQVHVAADRLFEGTDLFFKWADDYASGAKMFSVEQEFLFLRVRVDADAR